MIWKYTLDVTLWFENKKTSLFLIHIVNLKNIKKKSNNNKMEKLIKMNDNALFNKFGKFKIEIY